jgi:hypothetical protein
MYYRGTRAGVQTAFDDADPTGEPAPSTTDPLETSVSTTIVSGVTLVRVELRSTVDTDLRVRVANELDGPVLPPRREGVPAAGWDANGFRGIVPGSGRLGVGYACDFNFFEGRAGAPCQRRRAVRCPTIDTDRSRRCDRQDRSSSIRVGHPSAERPTVLSTGSNDPVLADAVGDACGR